MSFSIKITNNKTGETIVNEKNAIAIIGSYTDGNGTGQMAFINCGLEDLCCAVHGAKEAVRTTLKNSPEVALILTLAEDDLQKANAVEEDED